MDRRLFLISAAASALAPGLSFAQGAKAPATGENARLETLLDAFFQESVDESPERATSLGLDKGERAGLKAKLDDYSEAERARSNARAKSRLARLRQIDRKKLTGMAVIDYDVIDYQLTHAVARGERFKYGAWGGYFAPYVISQNTGVYQDVPDFMDNQHQVATAADAEAWLSRLSEFARALDQETERARADSAAGIVPPDFSLDLALGQLKALRDKPAGETVLVTSLARKAEKAGVAGDWSGRAEKLVSGDVYAALDRQIAAVQAMRAKATSDAGVWKNPDGEAYYAAAIQASTTTSLTPAEVHQMGLDQVADLSGRLDAILKSQGMTQGTVAERLDHLNRQPDQLYPNTDEGRAVLIEALNVQVRAMAPRLPTMFNTLPKAKVEIKRVPPFIQDGAANGYYQRAALDGSRPANFFINLKDTGDWPKYGLASLTYHESIPGHHLQISLAMESQDIPMIRRVGGGFSAYSEGWALYAEQLADEMGVYDNDPLGKAGFLQSFLFRAARLVVDTGIHYKRWNRDQATDYMVQATGFARPRTQREVERYCTWPGQACSYKVGHSTWVRIRDEAKAKMGGRFDIRGFHDAALLSGAMPLTVLERRVKEWSAA